MNKEVYVGCYVIFQIHLAKYGVFIVELICSSQGEEKLTSIIVWPSICHGNQTSSIEAQSSVEFILNV